MSDHGGHNTLLRLNMLRFLFSKRRIGALRKPVARRMFETPLGTRGPFSRVPRVPCSDSPGCVQRWWVVQAIYRLAATVSNAAADELRQSRHVAARTVCIDAGRPHLVRGIGFACWRIGR